MLHELKVPAEIVESLITWSDVQSIINRVTEAEVIFRVGFARSFVSVAIKFFKWYRTQHSAVRLVDVLTNNSLSTQANAMRRAVSAASMASDGMAVTCSALDVDDIITDAGGDEEGDEEEQDDDYAGTPSAAPVN